jgi:hypothetical protein
VDQKPLAPPRHPSLAAVQMGDGLDFVALRAERSVVCMGWAGSPEDSGGCCSNPTQRAFRVFEGPVERRYDTTVARPTY